MSICGERRARAFAAVAVFSLLLAGSALLSACSSPRSAPLLKAERTAGGKIFDKWCSDCHHTPAGPGSMAIERRHHGEIHAVIEERKDMNPDAVKLIVRQGMSFMPSFRKTEISDAELSLLAAYVTHSPELVTVKDGAAQKSPQGGTRK
jgi:(+)-pinoresinol hydroxylase